MLTVETEWAGMEVECPLCHGKITVPYFQTRSTPSPPPSPVMPSRMGSMPRQAPINQYYGAGSCNAAPDIKLYSPLGIGIVGFFFTPLVAEWLIFKNWKALEEDKEVKKSVIGYIVMIIAMFLLFIFFNLLGLLVIGAILCMFFIDNRLLGKLFSFVFPLDKLDYGWYVTCGVYVKNKVGRTFSPGENGKKRII